MTPQTAKKRVEEHGILLVYPIENRPEPRSLWSEAHGDEPMRWEWDNEGDRRVHDLWHLRERLASSKEVVYAKWYRGRATFFAKPVFEAMLATLRAEADLTRSLPSSSRGLLDAVLDDSPLSTRVLKQRAELVGRENERAFTKGMDELWSRMLIVGAGEVDDGAFPSLLVGATELLFEDLWLGSAKLTRQHTALLDDVFERAPLFGKVFEKARARVKGAAQGPQFETRGSGFTG